MGLAVLVPGQGSQHPAMFDRLDAAPLERRLGRPFAGLSPTELAANRTAQLALTAHALAAWTAIGRPVPFAVMGYSVGEIAAAAIAGAMDPEVALDLVERRAALMDRAAGGEPQGLLAVLGVAMDRLRRVADEAGAHVAIVNGRDHVVLGGPAGALDAAAAALADARHLRHLPVAVAAHTPLMAKAAAGFAAVLAAAPIGAPRTVLVSGLDGRRLDDAEAVRAGLARQVAQTLDIAAALAALGEYGSTRLLELGPGASLGRLAQDALPALPVRAFEAFRTAAGAAAWAAG